MLRLVHQPPGKFHSAHFVTSGKNDRGETRLGITVSGKVGNAVARNRIKRSLRELLPPPPRVSIGLQLRDCHRQRIEDFILRDRRGNEPELDLSSGPAGIVASFLRMILIFLLRRPPDRLAALAISLPVSPELFNSLFDAIEKYEIQGGGWLALGRLARCRPAHPGGYDPVR